MVDYVLTESEVDRVLTQYRESPKLLHVIRTYLQKVEDIVFSIQDMPSYFEIETAVGDQLTLIGKRLGWPRCHCVCVVQPVFGFACEGFQSEFPLVGFCEPGTWVDCGEFGYGDICISDDEMYRRFLLVRRYQILAFYDLQSLTDAIQTMYGPTATVLDAGNGRVVIAPGRDLTDTEQAFLQLVPRVLPVAPGIRQRYHFGTEIDVFGFGDGWGGFCEEWRPDGLPLSVSGGIPLVTEDGAFISTGPLTRDAIWMCETDVKPYTC